MKLFKSHLSPNLRWDDNVILITLILLLFLTNTLLWTFILPYNRGPDEYTHYEIPKFILNNGRIPIVGQDINSFLSPNNKPVASYASQPGLNYLISAFLMLLASPFVKSSYLFYIARLTSLLSGLGTVFLAFKITEILFEDKSLKFVVAAIIAFIPQFTFISSYSNSDSFSFFTSSLLLYSLLLGTKKRWQKNNTILLGFSLGLVLLSKLNTYILLPLVALYLIATEYKNIKNLGATLGYASITGAFVSGWWFFRSFLVYGDFLGYSAQAKSTAKILVKPTLNMAQQGYNFFTLLFKTNWLSITFKSFFGLFDYMILTLNKKHYLFFALVVTASLLGLAKMLSSKNKGSIIDPKYKPFALLNIVFIFMLFMMSAYNSLNIDFQAQGRYLFPAIIPISIIISLGLKSLVKKQLGQKVIFLTVIIAFLAINISSFLNVIVPNYYTNLDLTNATRKANHINLKNGQKISQEIVANHDHLSAINYQAANEGIAKISLLTDKGKKIKETTTKLSANKYIFTYKTRLKRGQKVIFNIESLSKKPLKLIAGSKKYAGKTFLGNKKIKYPLFFSVIYSSNTYLNSIRELYLLATPLQNFRLWLMVLNMVIATFFIWQLAYPSMAISDSR